MLAFPAAIKIYVAVQLPVGTLGAVVSAARAECAAVATMSDIVRAWSRDRSIYKWGRGAGERCPVLNGGSCARCG